MHYITNKSKFKVICLAMVIVMTFTVRPIIAIDYLSFENYVESSFVQSITDFEAIVDNDFIAAILDEVIETLKNSIEYTFSPPLKLTPIQLFEQLEHFQRVRNRLTEKTARGYALYYCQETKLGIVFHYENCNCDNIYIVTRDNLNKIYNNPIAS